MFSFIKNLTDLKFQIQKGWNEITSEIINKTIIKVTKKHFLKFLKLMVIGYNYLFNRKFNFNPFENKSRKQENIAKSCSKISLNDVHKPISIENH